MNSKIFAAVLIGVLLIGAGFFSAGKSSPSSSRPNLKSKELPEYVYANEQVLKGYKSAIALYDIYEKMPCYCGCVDMRHGAEVIQHKNLRDCFIKDDGSYEEHAAGCELCVVIALDVYGDYIRGASIKEIRTAVERDYSQYGPPTNTPPV